VYLAQTRCHDDNQKGKVFRMKEGYTWATCSKVIQSEVKTLQKAVLKTMPNASPLIGLETPRLPDEDAAFEVLALERWLDDGGIQDATSDREDLAEVEVLNQFH
jgi:hypothetical protein